MRWFVSLVTLVAACDSPCELDRLPDCPDCGPGEIRHGVSAPIDDIIDPPPIAVPITDGVACVMCDALHRFDAGGTALGSVGVDDPYWLAVAPDGSYYTMAKYQPPRRSDGYSQDPRWRVIGHEADGHERWRVDLDPHDHADQLAADNDGPYIGFDAASDDHVIAYSAATGERRWTDLGNLVVPARAGGAYVFAIQPSAQPTPTATIVAFDPAHAERWRCTLSAQVRIDVLAAHDTGIGLAIVGQYSGIGFDLCGTAVAAPNGSSIAFVALLDGQGRPLWAHALDSTLFIHEVSITSVADAIVIGYPRAGNAPGGYDGFVATFDAQGPRRVHAFSGDDDQRVRSVVDAGDGSVWVTLDTIHGFTLGDAAFAGDASPRRYLIDFLP